MKHTDNTPTINPNNAELRGQNQAAAAQLRAQLVAKKLTDMSPKSWMEHRHSRPLNATDWPCYYKVARARNDKNCQEAAWRHRVAVARRPRRFVWNDP